MSRACLIEILPASPIAWISLSAIKALYSWMPMALSESLCIEIDIVSINSLLTLLIPEFGAKMISGNLEQIRAFVYSKRSLSPDFNAMLISLIDSNRKGCHDGIPMICLKKAQWMFTCRWGSGRGLCT